MSTYLVYAPPQPPPSMPESIDGGQAPPVPELPPQMVQSVLAEADSEQEAAQMAATILPAVSTLIVLDPESGHSFDVTMQAKVTAS